MSDQWFYAKDGQQFGPVPMAELKKLAATGVFSPTDHVWCEGMSNWASANQVAGIFEAGPSPPPSPLPPPTGFNRSEVSNKKVTAGVLALLLGAIGVHKFVLGMTGPGLIMLLGTILTCGIGGMATSIVGLIEGIIYLSKSEEEFYRDYMVNKKNWF